MSGSKITEQQNSRSHQIDTLSIQEILQLINSEDALVAAAVQATIPEITNFVEKVVLRFQIGGKLFYVGSGTSGRLGILDAAEIPPTYSADPMLVQGIIAGGYNALVKSVEGAEDIPEDGAKAVEEFGITEKDVLLGITASSSTPFVLGALEEAHNMGATTGLLICNRPPQLNWIDHIIPIITGPEIITGSTRMKAGTATKLALNMITTTAMIKLNKTYGNLMVDLKASNNKLWDRGSRIIQQLTSLNYENARILLESAQGEVKAALVMYKKNTSFGEAKTLLEENEGKLRNII
jgi:N-acetylmuramic acid 6-phosphate etherase